MTRVPVAERRRLLVAAALRVMLRDGVAAATTRHVAAEADMTLAIVHYCFETKNDLLREAYVALLDAVVRDVRAQPTSGRTAAEEVEATLLAPLRAAEADPGPLQLLQEFSQYALRRPELADLPLERARLSRRLFTTWVDRLAAERGLRWPEPAEEVADAMTVLLDGVLTAWLVERDDERARAQVHRAAADLLRRSAPRVAAG